MCPSSFKFVKTKGVTTKTKPEQSKKYANYSKNIHRTGISDIISRFFVSYTVCMPDPFEAKTKFSHPIAFGLRRPFLERRHIQLFHSEKITLKEQSAYII